MPNKLSLHIGINECDPEHYGGWDGKLEGCENDCNVMSEIALRNGFDPRVIKTKEATRKRVMDEIISFTEKCEPGDTFLLTYAGHGNYHKDHSGDETDGYDETWVLYDDELFDDEIHGMFTQFQPGVRVVVFSDSCHSASVSKDIGFGDDPFGSPGGDSPFLDPEGANDKERVMPLDVCERVAIQWADHLRGIRNSEWAKKHTDPIAAHVLTLSGCRDDQRSKERNEQGLFTTALIEVWDDGKFSGSYQKLRDEIVAAIGRMPNAPQEPQITPDGDLSVDLRDAKPFE